jgi:hypothetical protein
MPLPVAGEVHALAALHRQRGHAVHLIAIRDAAVILAPRRLLRVSEEISASNVIVNADFGGASG